MDFFSILLRAKGALKNTLNEFMLIEVIVTMPAQDSNTRLRESRIFSVIARSGSDAAIS